MRSEAKPRLFLHSRILRNRFIAGLMRSDASTSRLGKAGRKGLSLTMICSGVILAIGVYACGQETPPANVAPRENASVAMTGSRAVLSDRAAAALKSAAWVGEVHHAAMQDLLNNREAWIGNDPSNKARVCSGMAKLAMKHLQSVKRHGQVKKFAGDDRSLIKAAIISARQDCAGATEFNIFAANSPFASVAAADEDWLPYAQSIHSAIYSSDGSEYAVSNIVTNVLNSASGLGTEDFATLAAVGAEANSSAAEWNAFGSAGGYDDFTRVEPTSIFATIQWWRSPTMKTLYSDVGGCITGALAGGGPVGCAIWGLGSSGLYIISIM